MGGKQAALSSHDVLVQQHDQTLRERMSDYPVNIELLSCVRSAAEQKRVLAGLADGAVDVVVGDCTVCVDLTLNSKVRWLLVPDGGATL